MKISLKTKLLVRLLLIVGSFGLLLLFAMDSHLRTLQEAEVEDKSTLILAGLTAVQAYVRGTLRPAMYEHLPPGAFALEAMSTSFITRKVMSDLNMAKDQYTYRRVALDPRNPEFAANALEQSYIAAFRENPGQGSISEYRSIGGEEVHVTARAVVFEGGCLTCHGRPADAPGELLARYGDTRGFGRFEGEIGGLDLLIMPVEREAAALRKASFGFLAIFALGTALILASVHFFSDRILLTSIGRLSGLLRTRFPDEAGQTLDVKTGKKDEIEDMMAAVERFADRLSQAKLALADYAANLETKVEERTVELRREATARRADVQLFLDMLALFEGGLDRQRLFSLALETVAGRFAADTAEYRCFYAMEGFAWPVRDKGIGLPAGWRDRLLDGQSLILPGSATVPVKSGDAVRGALSLAFSAGAKMAPREAEVLAAIGAQLGMAIESLEAMENILGQKAVLEAIFEGILDPLFLAGPGGEIIHANESAKALAEDLRGQGLDPAAALELGVGASGRDASQPLGQEREIQMRGGRTFSLRAYPVSALGPGRTIVYARDNTAEKAMLTRFQQSEKALAVGGLAAGLAHEINNPLGVILLYARLLADGASPEQAGDLGIIIRHTQQAQKVLEDLMRFAKPKPEALDSVSLSESAAFIARVFSVRAAKLNASIVTDVPESLPRVRGNAEAVEQIISNLVINSLDALEDMAGEDPGRAGHIGIRARVSGPGELSLCVSDNGPGFPGEHLTRIFDPFFTTKAVGRGSGLGLSVVFGLVRDLGGRIEAASQGGAAFTITFKTAE